MSVSVDEERAETRRRQRQVAEELKASGALDGIFAQMDAGTPLTGDDGLLSGIDSISLQDTLDEGQFFFGISVRAAMRLSGSHRKAPNASIIFLNLRYR